MVSLSRSLNKKEKTPTKIMTKEYSRFHLDSGWIDQLRQWFQ
jgi:hypothetical protein